MNRSASGSRQTLHLTLSKTASGWRIGGSEFGSRAFPSRAEAETAARQALARPGGRLTVIAANGKVEHMTILGAEAARRLNALEGVRLDSSSRTLLRGLDDPTMTAAQRRAAIVKSFKKAAAG